MSLVSSLLERIRQDINGGKILTEWLGSNSDPVHPKVAEHRANTCVTANEGGKCPFNVQPNWWDRIKGVAADWIRSAMELKRHLNLATAQDEHLGMCQRCGCCLPLKVWVPAHHLKAHINHTSLESTPHYCWMRKELLP